MTQPGESSEPEDTTGDGPVTLGDRTEPGGQGSPDTNQAKPEPAPPAPHEADPQAPREAPELATMNVGSADPQSPSHPATWPDGTPQGGGIGDSGGVIVPSTRPADGSSEELQPDNGPGPQDDPDLPE